MLQAVWSSKTYQCQRCQSRCWRTCDSLARKKELYWRGPATTDVSNIAPTCFEHAPHLNAHKKVLGRKEHGINRTLLSSLLVGHLEVFVVLCDHLLLGSECVDGPDRRNCVLSQYCCAGVELDDFGFDDSIESDADADNQEQGWDDAHCDQCQLPLHRESDDERREEQPAMLVSLRVLSSTA